MPEVLVQDANRTIVRDDSGSILYTLAEEVLARGAFGILEVLLADDELEEIMCNGPSQPLRVFHRKHGFCDTNVQFDEKSARSWIDTIVAMNKKLLSEQTPFFDGTLPDGSRINATTAPASPDTTFTIRKFRQVIISVLDLIKSKVLTTEAAAFLWCAVEGLGYKPVNMLVVGGTGTGKTTFLNAVGMYIPSGQRIVTIEDTAELQILHQNKVKMIAKVEAGVSMDSLLKNALRMRPDRLIVGEVRSSEAVTLFESMNTGHAGSMGTLHAESARETVTRVTSPPMNVPQGMLSALDLIVVLERVTTEGGQKRVVKEITEIAGAGQFNVLYLFDAKKGALVSSGVPSRLRTTIASAAGIGPGDFDLVVDDRERLLAGLLERQDISPQEVFGQLDGARYHWKEAVENKKRGLFGRLLHALGKK